jgi:pimeloyl-ACP methyl ester carboxylesterase
MGHSEGGMAAYLAPELGFKGIVISGFPCVIRGGIRAKFDTPVLAINWEQDPYFVNSRFKQCAATPAWQKRSNATELVLSGAGHATAYDSSAREAVSKFFKALIK